MDKEIKRIVELEIDLEDLPIEDLGVDVVSIVKDPAIQIDFMAFSQQQFVEPKAGENEDEFISRCVPVVINEGYENEQAVAICYSYWEGSFDGLEPYVDQDEEIIRKDFSECESCNILTAEEEEVILKWAMEYGETVTENFTYINPNEEFSTVTDIAKAVTGLDILSKMGIRRDEPAEIKYKYTGPSAQRNFCKAMLSLNKLYSTSDLEELKGKLSVINPGMGEGGINEYDIFKYKGGVACKHYWTKMALFKPAGSNRVLMIDQGPAEGEAGVTMNSRPNYGHAPSWVRKYGNRRFSFSLNEEQRIIAGPLMIPNKFIIRRDKNADGTLGDPYYVFFSKDTIKRIQERFNTKQKQNVTDVEHDGNILNNNILLEQWIVESRQYDKSKYYGFDNLPLGTWMGVYKINDDKTWNKIRNGELKGFSIAGDFINKAKPVMNSEEELLSKINNILNGINE